MALSKKKITCRREPAEAAEKASSPTVLVRTGKLIEISMSAPAICGDRRALPVVK